MGISVFFLGFAAAFALGWLYTLILFGMAPIIASTGVLMAVAMEDGFKEQMKSYGQSAGYAEQALQAIKVVHTYGQEELENSNYSKYLDRASNVQKKLAITNAIGLSAIFLIMLGFYGYSFFFGGVLKTAGGTWALNNFTGEPYSGGEIIGIMFSVLIGVFAVSAIGPMVKAITEGKIAGKLAYDVIDAQPEVNPNATG